MSLNISEPLSQIYQNWLSEDRAMEATLREIRAWMKEVEQLGIPHFGETATRLEPLRDRLVKHFEREDEMITQLASSLVEPSAEFDHLRFESTNEHGLMLAHLDDLLARLSQTDPPFRSWQAAMQEVEKFVHRLEQHESTETRSIGILLKESA
ncbi:hemerythrin domain-containing protein [Rhodopirellula sp. JC639]|uniref:hemerythrin domain-containing protein n=1 Tax=Stieleria mannarensis TaxID=2755585 RepID=UPI00160384B4|nr:hemerythrin domain-containing protein [Rhodopirellula sp. JC639]